MPVGKEEMPFCRMSLNRYRAQDEIFSIYTLNDVKVISSHNDTRCETMVWTFKDSTNHSRVLCRVMLVKGVPSLGREGNMFGKLWRSCRDLCDML